VIPEGEKKWWWKRFSGGDISGPFTVEEIVDMFLSMKGAEDKHDLFRYSNEKPSSASPDHEWLSADHAAFAKISVVTENGASAGQLTVADIRSAIDTGYFNSKTMARIGAENEFKPFDSYPLLALLISRFEGSRSAVNSSNHTMAGIVGEAILRTTLALVMSFMLYKISAFAWSMEEAKKPGGIQEADSKAAAVVAVKTRNPVAVAISIGLSGDNPAGTFAKVIVCGLIVILWIALAWGSVFCFGTAAILGTGFFVSRGGRFWLPLAHRELTLWRKLKGVYYRLARA
jgi:hypothetical protein